MPAPVYTPWSGLFNNIVPGVIQEVGDIDIIVHDTNPNPIIENAAISAKAGLFQDLMSSLPDLYANREGRYLTIDVFLRTEIGYTYNDLDSILDKIVNPSVLTQSINAKFLMYLWQRNVNQISGTFEINAQLAINERDMWASEYKKRLVQGKKNLIIDLNESGTIIDQDRPRTRNSFVRV